MTHSQISQQTVTDDDAQTYVSQVEQWWQRSGLISWQGLQYRIAD